MIFSLGRYSSTVYLWFVNRMSYLAHYFVDFESNLIDFSNYSFLFSVPCLLPTLPFLVLMAAVLPILKNATGRIVSV